VRECDRAPNYFVEAAGAIQVRLVQRRADAEQVQVRVDQAGQHGAPGKVDDLRSRTAQCVHERSRSDCREAPIANGKCFRMLQRVVDRVNRRAGYDKICRCVFRPRR